MGGTKAFFEGCLLVAKNFRHFQCAHKGAQMRANHVFCARIWQVFTSDSMLGSDH
jgi:hypothetical protein